MAGFGKAEFAQLPWGDTRSRYSGCRAMNDAMNAHRGTTVRPSARTASSTPFFGEARADAATLQGGGNLGVEEANRAGVLVPVFDDGRVAVHGHLVAAQGRVLLDSRHGPPRCRAERNRPGQPKTTAGCPRVGTTFFSSSPPGQGSRPRGCEFPRVIAAPGLHDHLGSAAYGTIGGHRFRLAPAEASPGSESGAGLAGTALGRRGAAPARAQAAAGSRPQRVTITGVPTLTRL